MARADGKKGGSKASSFAGVPSEPSFAVSEGAMYRYFSMNDLDATGPAAFSVESEEIAPELGATASITSSVFTLSNCILGASTLAMAFAVSKAGLVLFPILLALVGGAAAFSINLLCKSAVITARRTYEDVAQCAIGKLGFYITNICVIIQQLGAAIAYIKIVGEVMKPLLSRFTGALGDVSLWQVAITALIMFPLCMLRRMDSLRFSSFASLAFIAAFVLLVLVDSGHVINQGLDTSELTYWGSLSDALEAVPLIAFAFVCHMNVFPVFQELRNPSEARMTRVGVISCGVCFFVYIIAGTFGYLAFQQRLHGDLIQSYDDGHIYVSTEIVDVFQFGIGLALTFAFPVVSFELRHSLDSIVFGHRKFTWARHTALNVVMVGTALIVAIEVPQVTKVFGVTGATTSALVVFVLPPLYYLYNETQTTLRQSLVKKLALVEMVAGLILMPVCLVVTLSKSS